MNNSTEKVLAALADTGILLVQDQRLPNIVSILTGEVLATSWWSHARGQEIFAVLSDLEDHPDVLFLKLVKKKVTLVHRRLWPALLGVVSKPHPWQLDGLSAAGRALLARVNEAKEPIISSGAVVKELEIRLLAHTREVHLESGKHGVALQRWSLWARQNDVKPLRSSIAAQREIEKAVERIGATVSTLPWSSGATGSQPVDSTRTTG